MGLFFSQRLSAQPRRKLLLQWHISEACNLRCRHCYQEGAASRNTSFTEFQELLAAFEELLDAEALRCGIPTVGHVTLSGGEPLLHPDLFAMVAELGRRRGRLSWGILSNGTLLDVAMVARLKAAGVGFVQVSIEGTAASHDAVRGEGSHAAAVAGLQLLTAAGVRSLIAFTARRSNFHDFPAVAELGRHMGVTRVWADRLIPLGSGAQLADELLSPQETEEFIELMAVARQRASGSRTEIHLGRALQFLAGGDRPYRCRAGDTLLTLLPDGTLLPCRRLPLAAGNALDSPLHELYRSSPLLRQLRESINAPNGCAGCNAARACRGGLRCLSQAVHGDWRQVDPGCWLTAAEPARSPVDLTGAAVLR